MVPLEQINMLLNYLLVPLWIRRCTWAPLPFFTPLLAQTDCVFFLFSHSDPKATWQKKTCYNLQNPRSLGAYNVT
jgi:hypothetical protein